MNIQTTIQKFKYEQLNNYIYGGAHEALIGEWIRWWITDSIKGEKGIVHSVINPAMQARFWSKPYYADVLFAEHIEKNDKGKDIDGVERDFFRIVGVAEIENDNRLNTLKHKINSLYAYEKCKDKKHRLKFPDLKFDLLCTYYFEEDDTKKDEIKKIKDYIKQKSKNSKIKWVYYILKKAEIDDDYFFKVTGYARDPSRKSFYYSGSFLGKPIYYIFQRGKQLRIKVST